MKKTAIIYSFNTKKTAKIADQHRAAIDDEAVELVNAEDIEPDTFMAYEQMILGAPTWFDGELPNYWDEFVPAIEDMDLSGKIIAIYGLGDQKNYAENFQDAIGILAEVLEEQGATIIGHTSTDGYEFERSRGVRDGKFLGLAIDYENQGSKNKTRISNWVKQLKKEFS